MSKYIIAPPDYDEPDEAPGSEPDPRWCRALFLGTVAFYTLLLAGILLLWSCQAKAGTQVYLEDEQDLGNGYKLCIYSEGVTITRPSYQLCPISIEV